jgi:Zn-dependent peptidase ImmA (M78 family)
MSIASLLYRAHAVGHLGDDAYRNAMKYMSMRGWRKAEPGDRQMGLPESPQLFRARSGHRGGRVPRVVG